MFGLRKKDKQSDDTGMFNRLGLGLKKTRASLFSGLDAFIKGKTEIDTGLLEEIETRLILADVGVEATAGIIDDLSSALNRNELKDMDQLILILREQMLQQLLPVQQSIEMPPDQPRPFVILVVGVNGAGKTTTIGKLTNYYLNDGHSVLLAAADTFRAAAIEQIQAWGAKTKVPVIAQKSGADAAAVVYDALQSARARGIDIVIADTAGRLHNKNNLMEELKKIRRTISKFDPHLPVEIMLILDAGTGQNAITQAQQFHTIAGVTGITLTKLDGTAKGGVLFALARALTIPVRFISIGEQLDDLRPFTAATFVDALLDIKGP